MSHFVCPQPPDPDTGRWLSRDPLENVMLSMFPSATRGAVKLELAQPEALPEGPNIYRYSKNNPIKLSDASGLACGSGWSENIVPDHPFGFDFTDACQAHDDCYGTCGADKRKCDELLYDKAIAKCESYIHLGNPALCRALAGTYYRAVRMFGNGPYRSGQKEGCCKNALSTGHNHGPEE